MKRTGLMMAAVAVLGLAGLAHAADEPENNVKYRQNLMKAVGGHMGAISGVVKGEVTYGPHVVEHARAINAMSRVVGDVFATGTDHTKVKGSRAKAEIWQNTAEWQKVVQGFQTASANLVKAAEGNDKDAVAKNFAALGQSCGACHKPFRAEQQ
jgi:cytochrome c556